MRQSVAVKVVYTLLLVLVLLSVTSCAAEDRAAAARDTALAERARGEASIVEAEYDGKVALEEAKQETAAQANQQYLERRQASRDDWITYVIILVTIAVLACGGFLFMDMYFSWKRRMLLAEEQAGRRSPAIGVQAPAQALPANASPAPAAIESGPRQSAPPIIVVVQNGTQLPEQLTRHAVLSMLGGQGAELLAGGDNGGGRRWLADLADQRG